MPTQDTSKIKEKILGFLRENGPSLPVKISKYIGMDSIFSSAFLSELLSEHKINLSHMRVGTSPVYFIPGSEKQLEKYNEHLNFREKEAYQLLKQKKFLVDEEQSPVIKVALRSIPDFAKSFEFQGKLIWRYFTCFREEYLKNHDTKKVDLEKDKVLLENKIDSPQIIKKASFLDKKKDVAKSTFVKKKVPKKRTNSRKNEKFFNIVKEFLISKRIEIIDIKSFSKDDLVLGVKVEGEEKMLIAYNKKRISEEEILKSYKKAKEVNQKYIILSFGGPLKKTKAIMDAIKNLDKIEIMN